MKNPNNNITFELMEVVNDLKEITPKIERLKLLEMLSADNWVELVCNWLENSNKDYKRFYIRCFKAKTAEEIQLLKKEHYV